MNFFIKMVVPFLPVFVFCFVYLFFLTISRPQLLGWKDSFLKSAVVWAGLVVLSTEILSIWHALNFENLVFFWCFLFFGLLFLFFINRKKVFSIEIEFLKKRFLSFFSFSFAVILSFSLGLLFLAVVAPPNNYDSMTYHMSRVEHWIQNQSVFHYPTNITRQLFSAPWAEFAILHFQILSRSDFFANLVQWTSFLGVVIGVMAIVEKIGGGGVYVQTLAALLTASLPMGILQATTTQNDLVLSFWVVSFVYFLFQTIKNNNRSILPYVFLGLSVGIGFLTKATMIFFIVSFCSLGVLHLLCKREFKKYLKGFVIVFSIALLFNVGHFYRNYDLGQHILMPIPEVSKNVVNERFSFKGGLSNTMRNILLHLNSPFEEINNLIFSFSKKIHQWMDVDFDDARYTYGKIKDFTVKNHIHEDVSGNFYHFLFLFISFMAIFLSRKKYFNNFYFSFLFFGNLLAFFIFSFYLKWQPWGSRLQLPFFMLAIASVVLLFQDIKTRWRFIVNGIIFFIVFSSSPYLLKNPAKRLVSAKKATVWNTSREDMYFVYHERLRKKEYRKIVNYIKDSNCHEIGLFVGEDDWEYPFFALFRKEQYPVHIEHVFVKNASHKYSDFLFSPCAVILRREISEIDRKKNEDFFKLKKYYSDYFELYLKE